MQLRQGDRMYTITTRFRQRRKSTKARINIIHLLFAGSNLSPTISVTMQLLVGHCATIHRFHKNLKKIIFTIRL